MIEAADSRLREFLADIENEAIDKTKWIYEGEIIPSIRINRDVVKEEGTNGGVQYRGFSNLLDFYIQRKHINQKQHNAGYKFYRLWHFTILRDKYAKCNYGDIRGSIDYDDLAIKPQEYLEAKMAINNPFARIAVFDVCCHSISPGRRKMGLVLQGLDDLIKHFS